MVTLQGNRSSCTAEGKSSYTEESKSLSHFIELIQLRRIKVVALNREKDSYTTRE